MSEFIWLALACVAVWELANIEEHLGEIAEAMKQEDE